MVRHGLQGRRADAHRPFAQALRVGGLASARRMLPKLADAPGVRLPDAQATTLEAHRHPGPDSPSLSVACTLRALGTLSLEVVRPASRPPARLCAGTRCTGGSGSTCWATR